MTDVYKRSKCRMCESATLEKVMALTPTPPGNNFLCKSELDFPEPAYPLEVFFCRDCYHVQLGHVVDPKILYQKDYFYVSGTSSKFVEHLNKYALEMIKHLQLKSDSLVVDIGSNDGTCLKAFKQAGLNNILGIDPATKIAQRATDSGIQTIGDFFSFNLAKELRKKFGPAKLITSHNACAHIDHLDDVFHGVQYWLDDNGIFVLEVGYLLDVYENSWFDTIYHEHLDFHTVAPFKKLLKRVGMELIGVHRISPQGGSIRVMVQKVNGPWAVDKSVQELIALEESKGLDKPETYIKFSQRIDEVGIQLRVLIHSIKAKGQTIAAYGAPTKSTTLLAHFGLGKEDLDFIVDDNPLKQGLFSPVAHIPVFAPEELYSRHPDYLLILAWNFADSIIANNQRYVHEGGKFIVPMPIPRIID